MEQAAKTDISPKDRILQTARDLGLTMTAEFVPFSQSRNKSEKHLSLNWKVTIERMAFIDGAYRPGSERALLTTDYMAGIAHCPSYKQGDRTVMRDELVRWECENGTRGRWSNGGVTRAFTAKPVLPDFADVLQSLAMDYDVLDYSEYENWANEFCYDPDSRKGEAIYRNCLEIALRLRNGVGEEGMQQLRDACQDY